MTVILGHPTGNPNSHNAALAYFESGQLEAFCVSWMPSSVSLQLLDSIGGWRGMASRLARREFAPLRDANKVQGKFGEMKRLALRTLGFGDERLSYQANDWLMTVMAREVITRKDVTVVHAYEDCSLLQFQAAKRLDKACIYDMPIGYYPAWQKTQYELAKKYSEWLPRGKLSAQRYARPEQKRAEMELSDLVLVPSSFVEKTIHSYHPEKRVARASYGVDTEFWTPAPSRKNELTFIYAGQISLRKGIPDLLIAWKQAGLRNARLLLVGSWQLAQEKKLDLPSDVVWHPPCSPEGLRHLYRAADVFVLPSYFEGFGLVLLEAMACGLPAIASDATAGPDILPKEAGQTIEAGDCNALAERLSWCAVNRDRLMSMGVVARRQAEQCTWERYRRQVRSAVAPFV